jgi:hypothetical protein
MDKYQEGQKRIFGLLYRERDPELAIMTTRIDPDLPNTYQLKTPRDWKGIQRIPIVRKHIDVSICGAFHTCVVAFRLYCATERKWFTVKEYSQVKHGSDVITYTHSTILNEYIMAFDTDKNSVGPITLIVDHDRRTITYEN